MSEDSANSISHGAGVKSSGVPIECNKCLTQYVYDVMRSFVNKKTRADLTTGRKATKPGRKATKPGRKATKECYNTFLKVPPTS